MVWGSGLAKGRGQPVGDNRHCWVLPDDGIIDPIAVEIAASGERSVRLTNPERRAAAARIVAKGGTAYDVSSRLHVSLTVARKLMPALVDMGLAS